MTDLLLPRGSTKYKEQVQKLLESQPAVKKDRAGELPLKNSFLGLPGRGVVSRLGVQGRLKTGWGGRGRGEMAGGGGSGPRSGVNMEIPKTQLYQHSHLFSFFGMFFAFLFAFFCISQTGSHFFGMFFAFPKPGVIFCIFFFHFLDRVCHLHRLPDPDEKTTRKWPGEIAFLDFPARLRIQPPALDEKTTWTWQTNDTKMTTKLQKKNKQMTQIHIQQTSEFAGKIFINMP